MSDVKPALPKEQLEKLRKMVAEKMVQTTLQQVAASCLFGQTFGFSREDVELLREAAEAIHFGTQEEVGLLTRKDAKEMRVDRDNLSSLADRIEALLPPAGSTRGEPG
jgi:hypothetical protein